MKNPIKLIQIATVSLFFLCTSSGCRFVSFSEGGKTIYYVNFGFDTKIGKVELQSPQGSRVIIENLDTTSQALGVAAQALDKIP